LADNLENIVKILFSLYYWVIIAYIFMSWVPNLRETQIGQLIGKVVEPYLQPFRKIIPSIGMIDISPIVALLSLYFIEKGVIAVIYIIAGLF